MSEWGEDSNKCVIEKSSLTGEWLLWPPKNEMPYRFTSFTAAAAFLAAANYAEGNTDE